ncbi:MAG: site-2 protease family protein [Candidatus Dojkabacteria bacterium]|nr:site-2 protease family protein [Candidatus Dojkabacteria bacterium]
MIILKGIFWITFIIGLVIFIHELGHFLAAKLAGIKVEEFALGYGKKLFSKKISDTVYRVNLIPYGGYVKLLGEEKSSKDPKSFSQKGFLPKAMVLVAGVVMNFLLAVFTFYVILGFKNFEILLPRYTDFTFLGGKTEIQNKPFVSEIIEDTPAEKADFPANSLIWAVDDQDIVGTNQFTQYLQDHKGQQIKIKLMVLGTEWWQSGSWQEVYVIPNDTKEAGVLLGVRFEGSVASYYKVDYSNSKILSGFLHSLNFTGYNLNVLGELVKISFEEKSVRPVSEGVSGIVGLANTTYDLVKVGDIFDILNLLGVVNISLAIMNLLPIPALDGGYLLILVIEKITKRKVSEKYQEWGVRVGFILMIVLGILITVKDVIQFNIFGRALTFLKNLF